MSLFDKYGNPARLAAAGAAPGAPAPGAPAGAPANPMLLLPHGSAAAAGVISAAFFVISIPVIYSLKKTRFKTYILLLASTLLRGVAYALHAAAQAPGLAPRAAGDREAGFHALRAAGVGMAIGVSALIYFSWFKNCADWAKPFGARAALIAMNASRAMIPVVIICGPILGAVSAGLVYGAPHTAAAAAQTASVRGASMWGMTAALIVVCCLGTLAVACVFLGARRGRVPAAGDAAPPENVWRDVHSWILLPLAASLILIVAMAERIGMLYDPRFLISNPHLYAMSALPEVLNSALLAAPLLLGRIAMAYNWDAHMAAVGGGGGAGGAGAGDEKGASATNGNVVISADGEAPV